MLPIFHTNCCSKNTYHQTVQLDHLPVVKLISHSFHLIFIKLLLHISLVIFSLLLSLRLFLSMYRDFISVAWQLGIGNAAEKIPSLEKLWKPTNFMIFRIYVIIYGTDSCPHDCIPNAYCQCHRENVLVDWNETVYYFVYHFICICSSVSIFCLFIEWQCHNERKKEWIFDR